MVLVAAGTMAWGLMTGVAMVRSGLHPGELLLMGVLVFAGSSQLAAIPLIEAHAPPWLILAACFCVNLRFVVFSAHLRPYAMHRGLAMRMAGGYLMGDLNYVLFTQRFGSPASAPAGIATQDAYWLGLGVAGWTCWVVPSLAGIALGNAVPTAWGLGFAGILALVGMTCSLVITPLRAVSAIVSGAVAIVTFALPLKLNLIVAIVAAVGVCLALEASRSRRVATDDATD
jgi:predicted branched-subunit amino acid permease